MPTTRLPFFSVVIPTLNEEKFLPKLLKDLSKQSFKDFEVVVVDGSSEDKTLQKALTFKKKLSMTLVPVTKRNVSFQRNTGITHSKSEWVIFMDADNRLPDNFLEGIFGQLIEHRDTDIFTTWTVVNSTSKMDKLIENTFNLTIELYNIIGKPQGMGALLGVRRTVLIDHYFDENQHFLEDGMLVKQICEAGFKYKIFREPKFVCSLRRIKKEGNLKMLQTAVKYQFHYLRGGDFSKPFSAADYPMLGGSYYKMNEDKNKHWYSGIQLFIKTASKKQLEQARRIVTLLKENN